MAPSPRSIIFDSIKKAGFKNVEVLSEQLYMDGNNNQVDGKRKIINIVIKAEKRR
jgi:hypothetical protein